MLSSYLQLAKAIFLSNLIRLRRPYKLTLALTCRCNFRCDYCRTWRREPAGEMELEEIETFFRRQPDFSWIDLTGGEVTLRADLIEIIGRIIELSPRLLLLHFPTNGYLTEKVLEAAKSVKGTGLPRFVISISLDGPREIHDRLKGKEGSWEKALETFARLRKEEEGEAYLGMTLHEENFSLVEETISAVREKLPWIEKTDFHFNLAHSSFFYNNPDEEIGLPGELDETLAEVVRWYWGWSGQRFLERRYLKLARAYLKNGRCPLSCRSLSSSCFIDPVWTVYPCAGYDKPLGNLREADFRLARIWNDPAVVKVRQEIGRGDCPQCWTPCEAYQTVLGNLGRPVSGGGKGRR